MDASVFSFGFKNGLPVEADLMIDVRFLPNPYYSQSLRPLTGLDRPVIVVPWHYQRNSLSLGLELLDMVMPGYTYRQEFAFYCGRLHGADSMRDRAIARLLQST